MKNFLKIVFAIMLGVFLTRACSCTKDFSPIEIPETNLVTLIKSLNNLSIIK